MKSQNNRFPEFIRDPKNAVANAPEGMTGFIFDGAGGEQVVFWENPHGGNSPPHKHDFWEYAIVVTGRFDGRIGDEEVHLGPGDECVIPPGVEHEGAYSTDYRAIDVFGGKRVKRAD